MFRKRYLAATVSIFLLGVVFGIFVKNYDAFCFRAVFTVLAVAFTALSVVFICKKNLNISTRCIAVAIMAAAFSFGVLRVSLYNYSLVKAQEYAYKSDSVTLKVCEINESYLDVKVLSSDIGVKKHTKLRFYPEQIIENGVAGDIIRAKINYRPNNKSSYLAKDIKLLASGEIYEHIEGKGLFCKIRRLVSDSTENLYAPFQYAGAIAKAVTIGDRSDLDSYIFSLYKVSGISHILAISGLHITLIVMNFYIFLSGLGLQKKLSCAFASILAIFYLLLVGFTPGAVRSTIMILFLLGMRAFVYRVDNITTLFIVLLVLLLQNPYAALSASLQLSFLCSLGIILINPFLDMISGYFSDKRKNSRGHRVALYKFAPIVISSLIITIVSSVFTFPVICNGFDCISYISPLLNLIAVPLFSYAVGFALVAYLLSAIYTPIAAIIAFPAGVIFDFITIISRKIYELGFGSVSTKTIFAVLPLFCSIVIIAFLVVPRRRRLKPFFISLTSFCIAIAVCGICNQVLTKKEFIEYGEQSGDYVYYQSKTESIYIDVGGFSSVTDVVYNNGRVSLQTYIITKYDEYTFKRFDNFSSSLNVSEIVLKNPSNQYEYEVVSLIKNLANERNCDIIFYDEDYIREIDAQRKLTILFDRDALLVCFDDDQSRIRFIGEGFDHKVYCDIAVAMNGYSGTYRDADCDEFYASESFINNTKDEHAKYFKTFDKSVKFRPR